MKKAILLLILLLMAGCGREKAKEWQVECNGVTLTCFESPSYDEGTQLGCGRYNTSNGVHFECQDWIAICCEK